jgi:very-short-patch-repair endonuclease
VKVHWNRSTTGVSRVVASPVDALLDWSNCVEREWVLGSANDLVRHGHPDASAALAALGVGEFDGIDGICESGTEVVFYRRMLTLGLAPWRQVPVPGAGRLDFLFGTCLVVEVDGRTFHDTSDTFEADRHKDALVTARGGRVLRFSHDQVLGRWPEVAAAVHRALPFAHLTHIE